MGRIIIFIGLAIVGLGALVLLLEKVNIRLGRLPGDIVLRSKGATFYLPIVTCILLSIVASLGLWLFNRR